ncbi:hypothetical protein D9M69_180220 [compost metagenome]
MECDESTDAPGQAAPRSPGSARGTAALRHRPRAAQSRLAAPSTRYPAERCKRIETEKLSAGCTVTETSKVSPAASR